ncbi:hypothetical protein NEUTE1DRAFT_70431 [Neurospora tetrasperma FGSC 2508]|uniref:UBX domain-containing protein 2 n=1 Tax=Neurospora tetrasperma (strain FGSC 2508 / ATCC MYA-4615 / P0657) TaxID=510951 RepID=F8MYA4_NEUT8|nr:uncharacterized protein NEUTE1DRAFT_70431 [Neurospora tetrasperma FGSC 2508]EGO51586.1 hypothetical protein NEUTE1DRAFT_70431 [Neurospora tetrasperma FGSC 2508]EGZ78420.1 hypothetical protein NEUTE2DRAFT_102372 [Neurospora tetrasperma FGSC 2509]
MFFTGTLQEGIAAAIQQTRSLVCFVTDDNTESQQWETEFLKDEAISPLLESRAVVLKLVAGSTEEGYLAQLFPLPKKPTVVVLRGGQLKEYIAAGVTKEEFLRRLGAALGEQQAVSTAANTGSASVEEPETVQNQEQASPAAAPSDPAPQPSAGETTAPATSSTEDTISQQPPTDITTTTETTETTSSSSPTTTTLTTNTTQQARIQAILTERAARLAAQKKQQEEAARAAARARAAAEDPNSPARQAADALRKKQQEAREERQRILKAIEDDKAARKARQSEKQREKEALAATKESGGKDEDEKGEGLPFAPASPMLPRGNQPVKSTGHCALQVRLTDGSTIRSRFSAEKDTVREVREWVEATVAESLTVKKGRYTFKVLLTPQPSRRIEQAEEGKTLGELGLAPSSTLILVPAAGESGSGGRVRFAAAQADEGGNIFQRLIGFLSAFFSTVVAFFSTLFSVSGPPNAGPTPEEVASEVRGEQHQATRAERASGRSLGGGGAGAAVNRGAGSRIKGFGDERRDEERKRNDQQFYNGNSTNFEPRHDDDDN